MQNAILRTGILSLVCVQLSSTFTYIIVRMERGYYDVTGATADPLYRQWAAFDDQIYSRILAPQIYAQMFNLPVSDNTSSNVSRIGIKYSLIRKYMVELLNELNDSVMCTLEHKIKSIKIKE